MEQLQEVSQWVQIEGSDTLQNPMRIVYGEDALCPTRSYRVVVPDGARLDFFAFFLRSFFHADLTEEGIIIGAPFRRKWVGEREVIQFDTSHSFHRLCYRHGSGDLFTPQKFPWIQWPDFTAWSRDADPERDAKRILRSLGCRWCA